MEKADEIEKYFSQALELEEQGKTEEAIKVYTRLIELEPEQYVNYYNRGVLYGYLHELDKAIADYDKALELNPNHTSARGNRSIAYSDKGELDKAIVDSEKCVEMDPACFASINLPNLYYRRADEINKIKEKATFLLPALKFILKFLGYCYLMYYIILSGIGNWTCQTQYMWFPWGKTPLRSGCTYIDHMH